MTHKKLYNQGYSIIPIAPNSKAPGFEGWQNCEITTVWPTLEHGTGIRTGDNTHVAIDIDIYDPAVIMQLHTICSLFIPGYIYRVGQPPKFLVPVLCPEITSKLVSKRFRNPADDTINAIEILSQGQQYIHTGIHPDTLNPYTWSAELPPLAELPVVTLDIIQAIFEQFYVIVGALGWEEIVTPPSVNRNEQTPRERIYNQSYNIESVLEQYGWTSAGANRWTRPGKTSGVSGTVTGNVLWCFTSTSMLEPSANHRPYDIVLAYGFNGNEEPMIEHVNNVITQQARETFSTACSPVPADIAYTEPVTPEAEPTPQPDAPLDCNFIDTTKTTVREGTQFMTTDIQIEFFKNQTYVTDSNTVLIENGMMLDQSTYNSRFGGYIFFIDNGMDKTVKKAWDVFTNSQAINFPKVDHTCFEPQQGFGDIIIDSLGHANVNVYRTPSIKTTHGDVTPYTDLIKKMIPNDSDRAIFHAYCASIVQHQGVKFQWCPLIQGVQGNGKSLIARCLKYAIGSHYCHSPNPSDISNKFNSWLESNILIVIEEIKVAGKWEIMETLKPMITQSNIEIQGKGKDQRVAKVCANFIFNSNHKDALIKTKDDRRICPFFTAQQEYGDIERDGMDGEYFPNLYKWLRGEGFAIVADFLQNYPIPDALNPATDCHRAPITTSTLEAIDFSLGGAEQEVKAAVSEERPGFMGGWVSSMAMTKLFKDRNIKKPRNCIKQMMRDLDYITHPGLGNDPRTSVKILLDGGRPVLYVKDGHVNNFIKGRAEITEAYISAQGMTAPQTENV